MNILVVDDSEDNVELLCQILEDEYDTIRAYTGIDCIKLAKEQQPDLIILDVQMPEMDGYEVYQKLKEDESTSEIPVIFVTARYRDGDRVIKGLELGAYDYITKPIEDEVLLARVRAAIRTVLAEKALRESEKRYVRSEQIGNFGHYVRNFDKNKGTWSAQCFRIFGVDRDQFEPSFDNVVNLIHPSDRELFNKRVKDAISEGQGFDMEYRIIRPDGTERIIHSIAEVFYDKDDLPAGLEGMIHDITERKQAEEALRDSRHMLQTVLDSTPSGIFWKDRDSSYLGGNRTWLEAVGLKSSEGVVGKSDYELPWTKDQADSFREDDRRVMESGIPEYDIIEPYLQTDGTHAWAKTNKVPLRDTEGNVVGVLGTYEDITERKKAEEILKESEEKYRTLIKSANDAILIADVETGIILDVNKRAEELIGMPAEKIIGMHQSQLHPKEKAEQYQKIFKEHIQKGRVILEDNCFICNKDGHEIPVAISASVAKIKGRKVIQGFFRDITERKLAEEALRESEEKYRELINGMSDTAWVIDFDANFIDVNDAAVEVLGYSREELLSMGPQDIDTSIGVEEIKGLIEQIPIDEMQLFETTLATKDGKTIPVEVKSSLVSYQGKQVILSIARDITERKQAEEALRRSNEGFLKAHNHRKMLSKYLIDLLEKDRRQIAMELHDHIGQTLTSLKMSLEMIHEKLKPDNTWLEARITVAQERTIQAIKDVKNVSHGLRPAMIDALGVVSALRELFNEIQQQTDIEIHFFSQGTPKRFKEEKELAIYRIAQEALNNIIRHARAKNVFVNLVNKDDKLSLSVEDDGVGFDQDKVMKPSGPLGLLIMRERAVQLGGEFTIESQPGKGTHLLVGIPL